MRERRIVPCGRNINLQVVYQFRVSMRVLMQNAQPKPSGLLYPLGKKSYGTFILAQGVELVNFSDKDIGVLINSFRSYFRSYYFATESKFGQFPQRTRRYETKSGFQVLSKPIFQVSSSTSSILIVLPSAGGMTKRSL